MVIRQAILHDIVRLAEIHVLAWQAAYVGHMPIEFLNNLSIEKRTSDWHGWLSKPGQGTTIVVEDFEGVIGFCVFGPTRDNDALPEQVGEILALNVHPKFWRYGYGKLLCEAVLNAASQRAWKLLTLWTLRSNERAKLFYQSLGFKCDGAERIDSSEKGVLFEEIRYCKML
ncbi:MAG: GNAT family N-acetyltransferase [Gammaproteobacteria bacterium]|nr:GNAT family N-acetyltransferase [Gammaproteobacteria bacterium]